MKTVFLGVGVAAATLVLATQAANTAEQNIRVLGWYGNQPQQQVVEVPYWKSLGEKTNDVFSADFKTVDELGLTGYDNLRLLQSGAFDIVSFQLPHVSGDDPVFMGAELPGLVFDAYTVKPIAEAYFPVMEERLQTQYDAKLLAVWAYPPQILYCKGDIKSFTDIAGKKVRTSNAFSAMLIEEFGAISMTIAAPEVFQALMQGIVDCGITGSVYGNVNDWHAVTDVLLPIPVGGSGLAVHAVSNKFWNRLTAEQQTLLEAEVKELGEALWQLTLDQDQAAIDCNTGKECANGRPGNMTLLEASEEIRRDVTSRVADKVLKPWASDCEAVFPGCVAKWNETVGKQLSVEIVVE